MTDNFPYPKLYSNCCHAELTNPTMAEFYSVDVGGHIYGRCASCQDGCEYLTEEEMENEE